jgi:hypothetical protein
MRFIESILALAFVICLVAWMFETDFLLLDVLFAFGFIAIQIAIPLVLLIIAIWVIKELFN